MGLDLNFLVWSNDWSISDRGFEFYVKNCAYSQLETSGNLKFGRKITKTGFQTIEFHEY